VRINHKRFKTLKGRGITALVSLVGLPKGTFVLTITATRLRRGTYPRGTVLQEVMTRCH